MTASDRELDVVLHGATGFTGRLVAEHLAEVAPEARIGLSGRSAEKLAAVRDELPPAAHGWPLLVADSADEAALADLAARARVVASTVGPYARYGLPLVAACATAGTHYADITGETLFVRDSIDHCDEPARASGARLVHACGFDSVPSDLGVLLLAERVRADGAGELTDTVLVLRSVSGGFSGGTVETMRTQLEAVTGESQRRRIVTDPYALSPDRAAEPEQDEFPDMFATERLPDGTWAGPFVMAAFNTRIVRRSNALTGWSYGRRLRYREVVATGGAPLGPFLAGGMAAGLGALSAGLAVGEAVPPVRAVLDRVLPEPGQGPDAATRARGHFRMEILTTTSTGATYRATVAAQGDPGYAATSVMLGQSALALAFGDRDPGSGSGLPDRAGVLTPATGIGHVLVDRLRAAGFTLSAEPA